MTFLLFVATGGWGEHHQMFRLLGFWNDRKMTHKGKPKYAVLLLLCFTMLITWKWEQLRNFDLVLTSCARTSPSRDSLAKMKAPTLGRTVECLSPGSGNRYYLSANHLWVFINRLRGLS